MPEVLRYAAFVDAEHPDGGNPAGIVLDARLLSDVEMQFIAADVGYAETAFVTGRDADGSIGIRYFSPIAEVPFCGHATIATAVVLAEREGAGSLVFATPVGPVEIVTERGSDGAVRAAFTSVEPEVTDFEPAVLTELLDVLELPVDALDPAFPPKIAFAGNRHPVLVLGDAVRFEFFGYDPGAVRRIMDAQGWAGTVTVVLPIGDAEFEARNIFPVGTITEDPATGSAAAAFGGYLRALGRVDPPTRIVIRQGAHVGRPSLLVVDIPVTGGITVSGTALPIA